MSNSNKSFVSKDILKDAIKDSIKKLSFKVQLKNPVMFVVYIGSIITSLMTIMSFLNMTNDSTSFDLMISIFLWSTVLFANFAEAIAEGRGKAQASSLRAAKKDVLAKKLKYCDKNSEFEMIQSSLLKKGDIVLVDVNEQVPADGDVIEGVASVDESAITGESAPVIRESGGDRCAVTGGTTVVSDYLIVEVTSSPGESFLDKMIAMVEGAKRKKTPNEIALQTLLIALTSIFLIVTLTLYPFSYFAVKQNGVGTVVSITSLVALLVCLAPTTIGGLLSSIGIAGMSRLNNKNVLATSGRAIEAAGDVDVLLLDKTGTITHGNRQASDFIPLKNVDMEEFINCAKLSSILDETPEGRSIVVLAKQMNSLDDNDLSNDDIEFVAFSAKTRMSGANLTEDKIRKGASSAIKQFVEEQGGKYPKECDEIVEEISKKGGTPLVVCKNNRVLGVIYLKDILKKGVYEKFNDLRKMGIKTIMITGDNPLTAAAIAAEAGVDDFLAEATPKAKLDLIHEYQRKGHLVAMTGDGSNDAPALAQADVAVAMNTGTQAAKEAGNMVDLDSSPTKLIEIVKIGKQLLMTRGALTTFSIANDIAKYFAIIPPLFLGVYPQLDKLNIMNLNSPESAIMSAVIYNAIIIIALVPLALKGVKYRELPASKLLSRNLMIYGVGGIITPFICIKIIDMIIGTIL